MITINIKWYKKRGLHPFIGKEILGITIGQIDPVQNNKNHPSSFYQIFMKKGTPLANALLTFS